MSESQIVSYTSEEVKRLPSKSDWKLAATMTDEEIEAADALDPEVAGLDEAWMKNALVKPTQKTKVYAFFDDYVIQFFKSQGRGYQARMNAVLKAYVDAHSVEAQGTKRS